MSWSWRRATPGCGAIRRGRGEWLWCWQMHEEEEEEEAVAMAARDGGRTRPARGTRLRGRKREEIGEGGPTTDGRGLPTCRSASACAGEVARLAAKEGKATGPASRAAAAAGLQKLAEVVLAKEAGGSAWYRRGHPCDLFSVVSTVTPSHIFFSYC